MTTDTPAVDLCYWYNTDGYPNFRPMCAKGRQASPQCHGKRPTCPDYQNSISPKGPRYEHVGGQHDNTTSGKNL